MAFAMSTGISPAMRVHHKTAKSLSAGAAYTPRLASKQVSKRASQIFSRKAVLTTADLKNSPDANTWQNKLTEFMANSPINQAKKWVARQQSGEYDSAAMQAMIDATIAENKVVVFSFSTCPFCLKAKNELDARNIPYKALELNVIENGMAMRAQLAEMTDRTSVPNIFIDGKNIGGCNDGTPGLMPYLAEGNSI
eukprot:CAMPEP_0198210132 /NCGR_PEP_ID=MMETSP1445-20131203/19617_1 /TAXON_ID=36898 /ORGANISM="Pyramimonas sp., Strain CCMP2087" /LENGTH=194 /DNA_ID=CAMNT_0043884111 /DNA_START=108 /DNA_END=692 /DNA_ORIENTATION=+